MAVRLTSGGASRETESPVSDGASHAWCSVVSQAVERLTSDGRCLTSEGASQERRSASGAPSPSPAAAGPRWPLPLRGAGRSRLTPSRRAGPGRAGLFALPAAAPPWRRRGRRCGWRCGCGRCCPGRRCGGTGPACGATPPPARWRWAAAAASASPPCCPRRRGRRPSTAPASSRCCGPSSAASTPPSSPTGRPAPARPTPSARPASVSRGVAGGPRPPPLPPAAPRRRLPPAQAAPPARPPLRGRQPRQLRPLSPRPHRHPRPRRFRRRRPSRPFQPALPLDAAGAPRPKPTNPPVPKVPTPTAFPPRRCNHPHPPRATPSLRSQRGGFLLVRCRTSGRTASGLEVVVVVIFRGHRCLQLA